MTERIGTVEILRMRIYPLDPQTGHDLLSTSVCVMPGIYPLYRDREAYYWIMTGQLNERGSTKIGDGIFLMLPYDSPNDGPSVTFPSPRFGPHQWADFLAEPTCTDGDPGQRLIIRENTVSVTDEL